jgi:hypothetical protein
MIKTEGEVAALCPERNMRGKRGGLPPNVITLCASRRRPPSTAVILEGLKLIQVFFRIETGQDRKRVLNLAKELAPIDADTRI